MNQLAGDQVADKVAGVQALDQVAGAGESCGGNAGGGSLVVRFAH